MKNEITPEAALEVGIFLREPCSVLDLARIAAGCQGSTHRERIIDALRLLEAADDIANPDPWAHQHQATEDENARFAINLRVPSMVADAKDGQGRILRNDLCVAACKAAERGESEVTAKRLFLEWLARASDEQGRWIACRNIVAEGNPLDDKLTAKVDRRRGKMTDKQRSEEIETFRKSIESGKATQTRVVHDERTAEAILLGTHDFEGFLEFLRIRVEKYDPKPPRLKDEAGKFTSRKRDEKGRIRGKRN